MVKLNLNTEKHKIKQRRTVLYVFLVLCGVSLFLLKGANVRVEVQNFQFTESARDLKNPNRGFYHLYTFWITEEETDYEELIERMYDEDTDTQLTLVKICLQNYRGGDDR